MRQLAATLLVLSLFSLSARAEETRQAAPPTFTVAELAELFETESVPDSITSQGDFNADDQYVAGLRVWGGAARVLVDGRPVETLIKVFVHEGAVIAVKLEQLSADYLKAAAPQAQYEALRDELATALKPANRDQLGDSTAHWTHGGELTVEVSRGYDSQGMFFFVVDKDGQPLVTEFWQKWNAAIEEMAAGFFFFGF